MNSLQIGAQKQYSNGFMVNAEYQWTRILGTENLQDPSGSNVLDSYGKIGGITPQVFVVSYSYLLPFGKGQALFNGVNNLANKFISGWQISGITTFQTGQPFSVSYTAPGTPLGLVSGRASRAAGGALYPSNKTKAQWFNPGAFMAPLCYNSAGSGPCSQIYSATGPTTFATYGNSAYNMLSGPHYQNWDMNLQKSTVWKERYVLQLRADSFNIFNHPNFATPNANITNTSTVGTITSIASGSQSRKFEIWSEDQLLATGCVSNCIGVCLRQSRGYDGASPKMTVAEKPQAAPSATRNGEQMKRRYAIGLAFVLACVMRCEAYAAPRHVTVASLDKDTRELFDQSMDLGAELYDTSANLVHRPGYELSSGPRMGNHMVRESSWYALGLLLRDAPGDRQKAADIINAVLKEQYLTPGVKWYGTYKRTPQEPDPTGDAVIWRAYDPNWRVFIGTTFAMMLIDFPDRISSELSQRMYAAIDHAIEGEIAEKRLVPSYTNIALMYGFLCDFAAAHDKRADWQKQSAEWAESVYSLYKKYGAFFEYNSPTLLRR